jgi:hypothetical protein
MVLDIIRSPEAVPTARFFNLLQVNKKSRLLNTCSVMERGMDGNFLKRNSIWIM